MGITEIKGKKVEVYEVRKVKMPAETIEIPQMVLFGRKTLHVRIEIRKRDKAPLYPGIYTIDAAKLKAQPSINNKRGGFGSGCRH